MGNTEVAETQGDNLEGRADQGRQSEVAGRHHVAGTQGGYESQEQQQALSSFSGAHSGFFLRKATWFLPLEVASLWSELGTGKGGPKREKPVGEIRQGRQTEA